MSSARISSGIAGSRRMLLGVDSRDSMDPRFLWNQWGPRDPFATVGLTHGFQAFHGPSVPMESAGASGSIRLVGNHRKILEHIGTVWFSWFV